MSAGSRVWRERLSRVSSRISGRPFEIMTMLMEGLGDGSESGGVSLGVTKSCRLNISISEGNFAPLDSSLFKGA
jgi:hypothetical protein